MALLLLPDNRQNKVLSDCPKAVFARFQGSSYTAYTTSYTINTLLPSAL